MSWLAQNMRLTGFGGFWYPRRRFDPRSGPFFRMHQNGPRRYNEAPEGQMNMRKPQQRKKNENKIKKTSKKREKTRREIAEQMKTQKREGKLNYK